MANQLPTNAVKAVLREWLASKNAIFDKILHEVADQLAPIAGQEALNMLFEQLYGGGRDAAFKGMYFACTQVLEILDEVLYADEEAFPKLRETQRDALRKAVNDAQIWIGYHYAPSAAACDQVDQVNKPDAATS